MKSFVHAFGSSISASVAMLSPRYSIAESGAFYLFVFLIGIIFLAFDVRARDSRERMLEILDSRSYSNLELIIGRFLGMFMAAWIPTLILVALIQGLGWLLPQLGSPIGDTVEPFSLFSFPFFVALPAMAFCCAIVMLIALLVRNQFIALVASAVVIVGLYYLSSGILPFNISSTLDLLGFIQLSISSDIVPNVTSNIDGWSQRFAIVFLTLGVLVFAALVHPRIDSDNRMGLTITASVFSFVGIAILITVFQLRTGEIDDLEQWRQAHLAKQDEVAPRMISVEGIVDIDPGKVLNADLKLEVKAPDSHDLSKAIFSLNPGFNIVGISDLNNNELKFEAENGLLEIHFDEKLSAGNKASVQIKYSGKPNLSFAYLDSSINPRDLSSEEASIATLGFENAIFDDNYVALMPGIHWLPKPGVDVGSSDLSAANNNFYHLKLKVKVPSEWTVAGPGYRTLENSNNGKSEYLFNPQSIISETAILASSFKSYSTTINGILFEVLFHPSHDKNIEVLTQAKDQIKTWISDKSELAAEANLRYPFKAFTLVEVPNSLRGYKGGWRSETAMSPPSMALMKEFSLPTARFDFDATTTFGKGYDLNETDDIQSRIVTSRLIEFFRNDFTGGNLFTSLAHSIFTHQTGAEGAESVFLDYTIQQLTTLVLSDQQSYFSVARMSDVLQSMGPALSTDPNRGNRVANRMVDSFKQDLNVWNNITKEPIAQVNPWAEPKLTIDMLALKAGSLAKIIFDTLGPQKTGLLISNIINANRGHSYSKSDFLSTLSQFDENLVIVVDEWITQSDLPGFIAESFELYQLPSNNNGDNRFQFKMRIRNDENVTGYTRVSWNTERGGKKAFSNPIQIKANSIIEFAMVLSQSPAEIYIEPYLSLNRNSFLAKDFTGIDIPVKDAPVVSGITQVSDEPGSSLRVIVDDLDFVFESTKDSAELKLNSSSKVKDRIYDMGLPVASDWQSLEWSRRTEYTAWGKYRNTLTYVKSGDGSNTASVSANLPREGSWSLEIHLPKIRHIREKSLGEFQLKLISNNDTKLVEFDAKDSIDGWNKVADFNLSAGEVNLVISDKSNGEIVVVDAIAWNLN